MPPAATAPVANFRQIEHIVVLMLENRSFDHLLGYLRAAVPGVAGLTGTESNPSDPAVAGSPAVTVRPATAFAMPYDPGHEFPDVQLQIFGSTGTAATAATMGGFFRAAAQGAGEPAPAGSAADAARVMEGFTPDQLPVLTALAREFALCNGWFSSLPGPTWPNRFFVHAATSGGLTESPTDADVIRGYSFDGGTIYDALEKQKQDWRIYHDGLPQTAGIQSLRLEYINPLTKHFREMKYFAADVAAGALPAYTFIEPDYDTGHNYTGGNSMHPLNDIRQGEALLKRVYEAIRNSPAWPQTMLVITFDEHGGFYDHVVPPAAVGTGDDYRYATAGRHFPFDRLGVRVPGIVVSPYTQAGTILGGPAPAPATTFDHSSVLATVALRFSLPPLTNRDANAVSLAAALNLDAPRVSPADAPTLLPSPRFDLAASGPAPAASSTAPLSDNQRSFVALATACRLATSEVASHAAILAGHEAVQTQAQAAAYIQGVVDQVNRRRTAARPAAAP